jgi:hypothetical protein
MADWSGVTAMRMAGVHRSSPPLLRRLSFLLAEFGDL